MNLKRHILNCTVATLSIVISFSNAWGANTMSPATRPMVIELFTSQGCNSCPAAEALLGEYVNNPDALILAFHVDYWDDLGWRDPFGLPISNQRQQGYVQSLKLSSGFTPQSVIDGQISLVGSDRRGLHTALSVERNGIPITLTKSDNMLSIALPESTSSTPFDVNLVAYQKEAATPVRRGENAGHTLKEYNIVRKFQKLTSWNGHATTMDVPLSRMGNGSNHIAVIIQQVNQGAIVGAASLVL